MWPSPPPFWKILATPNGRFGKVWLGKRGWNLWQGRKRQLSESVEIVESAKTSVLSFSNMAGYYKVKYDRPGECSPEKDCLRWHWLTFRQPERKSSSESSGLCNVGRYYKNSGRDVIGQLIRDFIGRLSVEPRCNWLERLNSDWCVSIRLQVLGQYVYRRIRWAVLWE